MYYEQKVSISEILVETAPESELQQESLGLQGQIEPIRLVEIDPQENDGFLFRVIDGRRRLVDIIKLGKLTVEALVYAQDSLGEEDIRVQALTLNSGKPNFMDEADHVSYLITECGYTVEDIAVAVNTSQSTILNRLDLKSKLYTPFQENLRSGTIRVSAAYELVKISKVEQKGIFDSGEKGVKKITGRVKKLRDAKNKPLSIFLNVSDETIVPHSEDGQIEGGVGGPGLFLSWEEMLSLIATQQGTIKYQDKQYTIFLTEITKTE